MDKMAVCSILVKHLRVGTKGFQVQQYRLAAGACFALVPLDASELGI